MTMISSSQKVYSPDDVLKQLDSAITCVKQNIQCYCRDPLRDFTHSRKLDVDMIIRFLIQMESKSMKSELYNYFDNMDSLPTDSALCQQRNKLLPEAMKRVLNLFTRFFKHSKTINNYYLLTADGSAVNISFDPNDTATIRDLGDERQCSQYHINALYECLNHIYWNVNIDSSKKLESKTLSKI